MVYNNLMSRTKVIKFKNGATLLYKKKRNNNYTAVNIGFGSGSLDNEKNGVAHFLEHQLFKQTQNRTEEQINQDRDSLCFLNAYTSPYAIFVVFSRTNKLIDKSFEFASDILLNSKFSDKYIEEEKQVITEERRIENDKIKKNIRYQHNFILTDTPRTKDNILGSFEDIKNITKKDLQEYKDKFFVSQNFICSIVGKISLIKAKRLLKKYVFPNLKQDPNFVIKTHPFDINLAPSMQIYKNNDERTSIFISYKIDDTLSNVKYNYNYYAITRFLNCNEKSMYTTLRKKGLIYSASAFCEFSEKNGQICFSLQTGKDKVADCIDVVSKSIKDVLNGAITDKEIETTQKNYFYTKDERVSAPFSKVAENLAGSYALKKDFVLTKERLSDKAIKKLNTADVLTTAKEVFIGKTPYITFMGNLAESDVPTYEDILKKLKF